MPQLTRWFVGRPLVVTMIMIMVFALGFLTIADMRYEYNPAVDMGVVNVTTIKAGSGPEEIELAITLPLEEELLEVEGIKRIYSNSMENLSVITINLDLDAAEKQEIMRDIQQAVDRAFTRLPQDLLEKPVIEELSTLITPVMEVHVTGDVPEALLRDVARNVADGLREVDGVASVEKRGYRRPEVRIMLDSGKLARLGISHGEIITAIRARNRRDSGGAVDSFTTEKNIIAIGQFRDPRVKKITNLNIWINYRRMFGLFIFFYASVHLMTYVGLDYRFDLESIGDDIIKKKYIFIGFSAWLLLIPLAATSNKRMMKILKNKWKKIHRLMYLISLFGAIHYLWLVKRDLIEPLIFLTIILILLVFRFKFKNNWLG